MSEREEAVVRWLLSRDFEGVNALRAQVPNTRVVRPWGPGSASVDLCVVGDASGSKFADGPTPGQAWAHDAFGELTGVVLLWVKKGYLSALEYGWVTEDMPGAASMNEGADDGLEEQESKAEGWALAVGGSMMSAVAFGSEPGPAPEVRAVLPDGTEIDPSEYDDDGKGLPAGTKFFINGEFAFIVQDD